MADHDSRGKFAKGHADLAVGSKRGRQPGQMESMKNLALAVRAGIPVEVMVEFHLVIVEGFKPLARRNEEGVWSVTRGEGVQPTMEDQVKSLQWLTDRGHGGVVQHIALEAELKAQVALLNVNTSIPLGDLSPAGLLAVRNALRGALVQPEEEQRALSATTYTDEHAQAPDNTDG